MIREVTFRIKPPSKSMEDKLIADVRKSYRIVETIRQRLDGESYLYLRLESKDADS